MKTKLSLLLAVFALSLTVGAFPSVSQAVIISYVLHDHPNGGVRPPLYGLRLDHLEGANSGIYTFEFDGAAKSSINDWQQMRMSYDTNTGVVHIRGHMYGGLNSGTGYDTNKVGTFYVDYKYTSGVNLVDGDRIEVTDDNSSPPLNAGTVTAVATNNWNFGSAQLLSDKGDSSGLSFIFDNDGHRIGSHLNETPVWSNQTYGQMHAAGTLFVGRGWHMYPDNANPGGAQDFLFTAFQVPEPSAAMVWSVLGLGCVGLGLRRRK